MEACDYYLTPKDFERAKNNGISNELLQQRFYKHGWEKERAITEPLRGKTGWSEYKELAKQHGIGYQTFKGRRILGWDEHSAATTPVMSRKESAEKARSRKTDRVFTDEQIKQAARNGVSRDILWNRFFILKWDLKTAMNTPILSRSEAASRGYQASPFNYKGAQMFWAKKRA